MSEQATGGLIYKAMPAIMREVGAVEKGRKNLQQGYQFRGIDDLYAAVQKVMGSHGVSVAPSVEEIILREERQTAKGGAMFHMIVKVRHRFYGEDGSFIDVVTLGEAMDTGDKTSNKVMSVAMKYALIEAFCIPTQSDDDTENESPEVAPRQQHANGNGQQQRSQGNGQGNGQQRGPQNTSAPPQQKNGNGNTTAPPAAKPHDDAHVIAENFAKDAKAARTPAEWMETYEKYLQLARNKAEVRAIWVATKLPTDDPAMKMAEARASELPEAATHANGKANGKSGAEARAS